ncbi:PR domain zinc finger protein 14-like [Manduca sexta]|uniref:PR domain zinc finger protein 14-like n=1 Tax=Manduca sexta TaxID=7130 RepID=UPI00188FABDA|nr:PR domain zinc finger protein 14-like [Manduca sexta]
MKIGSLKKLIKHLKNIHRERIYAVKNYIVPFNFDTEELQCALCAKKFEDFKLLSDHTNEHFKNFECWLCNHWFINKHALELHSYRHHGGAYECSYCSSIFDTASEKSEHVRVVHYLQQDDCVCALCRHISDQSETRET